MALAAGFYIAGYAAGLLAFLWMARRRRLATSGVYMLAAAGLFGGLIGANLTQWLVAGSAGKTVMGGVAGGWLAVAIAKRRIGLRRPTGDLFAVAICAGEAVGRWGCFFGGCCYGKPAEVAWAVRQHGALRHPTQIYLSLANLLMLLALLWVERKSPPENGLFYLQGALYCAARFTVEFFRETPAVVDGLSAAQWACLVGFTFFTIKLQGLMVRQEPIPDANLS